MQRYYDDCVVGAIVVPKEILIGFLTVIFTVVYIQWNRRAASIDAIAYATKIRQQQQQAVDMKKKAVLEAIDDTSQENSDARKSPDNNIPLADPKTILDAAESQGANANINISIEGEASNNAENTTDAMKDTVPTKSNSDDNERDDEAMSSFSNNTNNQWRCACEGGFLPAGMLQSLGGAEAVFNMGIGSCYHTKGEMK